MPPYYYERLGIMKRFTTHTAIFILFTVADLVLTFIGTPDLKHEANPLSVFGWYGLTAYNVLTVLIFALFAYIAFIKYRTKPIEANTFFEFYLMLFYNRREMIVKPMMKFPKNMMPFFAMISYSACKALIAGRIVVVLEWIAVLAGYSNSAYFIFRYFLPLQRVDIWIFIIAFLVCTAHWMNQEYKKSKELLSDDKKTCNIDE